MTAVSRTEPWQPARPHTPRIQMLALRHQRWANVHSVVLRRLQYLHELLRNAVTLHHLEFHFPDCAVGDLLPLHVTPVVIGACVTLPCCCCTLSNRPTNFSCNLFSLRASLIPKGFAVIPTLGLPVLSLAFSPLGQKHHLFCPFKSFFFFFYAKSNQGGHPSKWSHGFLVQ